MIEERWNANEHARCDVKRDDTAGCLGSAGVDINYTTHMPIIAAIKL